MRPNISTSEAAEEWDMVWPQPKAFQASEMSVTGDDSLLRFALMRLQIPGAASAVSRSVTPLRGGYELLLLGSFISQ